MAICNLTHTPKKQTSASEDSIIPCVCHCHVLSIGLYVRLLQKILDISVGNCCSFQAMNLQFCGSRRSETEMKDAIHVNRMQISIRSIPTRKTRLPFQKLPVGIPKKTCSIYIPTGITGKFLYMVNNHRISSSMKHLTFLQQL